jgi:acetyl-CoA acetyltransferase
MKPVMPDGIHSPAAQTHPADGNACMLVTTKDNAKRLSADPSKTIQLVSYGFSRVEPDYMPMAPVPASKMALEQAGIKMSDVKVIKSHNPFAANDLYFVKEMGLDMREMNNYGSSIIFGHPQSPTVLRLPTCFVSPFYAEGGGLHVTSRRQ